MRRPAQLAHRFIQFVNQLAIPTIVLAELYAGAYKHPESTRLLGLIDDLLKDVHVLDFDASCALRFGQIRGSLQRKGISVSSMDLMIAIVALEHGLTLVTHNVVDFQHIPDLWIEDWILP
jgi:tRNA(fMet)-specific endonuclease VapC